MKHRFVALLAPVLLCAACAGDPSDASEDVGTSQDAVVTDAELRKFWDRYRRDADDIEKSWRSNNGGRAWGGDFLAWKESFLETALVDMYVATKDPKLTDELVKRADIVFSLRDDRIHRKDEVRGKVVKAWGRFPDVGRETRTGDWVCEMVQNGLITFPIAELVSLADKSPALAARYGDKIDRYREWLVETVDAFDDDWDDGGSKGFYRFPRGYAKVYPPHEGRYLPYNRALVMGRTMVMLEDSKIGDAKKSKYRERVRKIARFFFDDAHTPGSRYVWGYAPWEQTKEDVSHGGLDVDFFAIAGKAGYSTVGRGDIDRFIETFQEITKQDGKLAMNVAGDHGSGDQKDANEACGRYLDLAAYDARLVKRCEKVIRDGFDPKQLGYAKTLRYRR